MSHSSSQKASMKIAKVIGEGSYGCIHEPSLKCKNKNVDYKDKISKVSFTNEMTKELKEYDVMKKIDKKLKYHLGSPVLCDFDKNSVYNKKSLGNCDFYDDIVEATDDSYDSEDSDASVIIPDLSLLVMKNGGVDLEKFIDTMHKEPVNEKNIEIVEIALLEFHRIFMGLKKMIDNKVIHHDLKPQNIVFSVKNKRMNFIDFGMMTDVSKIIKEAKNSNYNYSLHHWSYPFETKFYNHNEFVKASKMTENELTNYFINIAHTFSESSFLQKRHDLNENKQDLIKTKNALQSLFSYIIDKNSSETEFTMKMNIYFTELKNTMLNEFKTIEYDDFIKKSLKTIDVFGVGIACVYFCNKLGKFMNTFLNNDLKVLFDEMVNGNFNKRINVEELIDKYEQILNNHGILQKHKMVLKNHEIVKKRKNVVNVFDVVKSLKKEDVVLNKKERNLLTKQPIIIKRCPENKVENPFTKRCVKMCDELHERDDHFVCVKRCPENKIRNPKTKRCVGLKNNKTKKIR